MKPGFRQAPSSRHRPTSHNHTRWFNRRRDHLPEDRPSRALRCRGRPAPCLRVPPPHHAGSWPVRPGLRSAAKPRGGPLMLFQGSCSFSWLLVLFSNTNLGSTPCLAPRQVDETGKSAAGPVRAQFSAASGYASASLMRPRDPWSGGGIHIPSISLLRFQVHQFHFE